MSIAMLAPAQRFMYEFGCFVAFWSNFELLMEVAISDLLNRDAKTNCRVVNPRTAGWKMRELVRLLSDKGRTDVIERLGTVFDIADRNSWIHGHILNPAGDFSRLTRLRIEVEGDDPLHVTNNAIAFDVSPFQEFYAAYAEFQQCTGISVERCDQYIRDLQT